MKLAIITSGGANFYSIEVSLQRLGVEYVLTNQIDEINQADGIILPGVGAAKYAMDKLKQDGLIEVIKNYSKPLLGICLGMQLLYEHSAEGDVDCLGIIGGKVEQFHQNDLVVPHMGWNNFILKQDKPIISGIDNKKDVYFVHSFYAPVNEFSVATTLYGKEFTAICQKDNFYGMQFHPEKSGDIGAELLNNFIKLL